MKNKWLENSVCVCGKLYEEFEPCPICGELTCLECDDWERHHEIYPKNQI